MKFHSLSLAMLAINLASCSVYASASDEPSTSTQSSLRGVFLKEDEESKRGLKRRGHDEDVCGTEGNECVSTLNARSSYTLMECFNRDFPSSMDTNVTIVEYFNGPGENVTVSKLTFPQVDFEDFKKANFNAGYGQPRFPAGIFYAEGEDEVIKAMNCAQEAGYKISPRGRGHSYQGLGSMDGYMVIDMSLMCNTEEFDSEPAEQPWLLGGGQKVIGSIKSGSGCTNAVMLAYTANEFPEGIYLIGSCPSVGIAGYSTGGGQGDTTPWVGLGIDDALSYDIVLYNGTSVTASPTENTDLYWALRGGGSGFGVITNITTAVISAPEEASNFTWISVGYKQTQNEAREFLKRFQDFLMPDLPIGSKEYKEKVRATSAKFGGSGEYNTDQTVGQTGTSPRGPLGFSGLFLGSKEEAESTFDEAGLLDKDLVLNPTRPMTTVEFSSWADAQLFNICSNMGSSLFGMSWLLFVYPNGIYNGTENSYSVDICEQLGIASTNCYQLGTALRVPKCNPSASDFDEDALKNVILPAIKDVVIEPQSWFNRPGNQRVAEVGYETLSLYPEDILGRALIDFGEQSWVGGLLHGRVDPEVLLEIANVGVTVNHFARGAPTLVERDETAYFSREEYSLLAFDSEAQYQSITSILVNQAYDDDASKLKGFYNYPNPEGNRNWREYYFGDNYERLSVVKAMYDETNGFGNPLQVEPAPL